MMKDMLKLSDIRTLLENDYLPVESGYGLTPDNLFHVCSSTYMPNVTPAMIDWWFGFIDGSEVYKMWHPRDHVYSKCEGPRNNDSTYVGTQHIVHEFVGGELMKAKLAFASPAVYFGDDWKEAFAKNGYGTAVCARAGTWDEESEKVTYMGHAVHLIKTEPDGCRMRSRFWLGDVRPEAEETDGEKNLHIGDQVPEFVKQGLLKHATEEMAILASKLPSLYEKHSKPQPG